MNRPIVVDASIVVKWLVPEEDAPTALALRGRHSFAVPDLLFPEIANILWKKGGIGQITGAEVDNAIAALDREDFLIQDSRILMAAACQLSRQLDHPAYDCFYLVIAAMLKTSFVTADDRLLRKLSSSKFPEWAALAVKLDQAHRL